MCAHPLAPDAKGRLQLFRRKLAQRGDRLGRIHDHLMSTHSRLRSKEPRLAPTASKRINVLGGLRTAVCGLKRGIEVRNHPHLPARRVGTPTPRPQRVDLRRGAILMTLEKRIRLRIQRRLRLGAEPPSPAAPALPPAPPLFHPRRGGL